MTPSRKRNLSVQLGLAYLEAENQVEKNILKDVAYEIGILVGESLYETLNLNQ